MTSERISNLQASVCNLRKRKASLESEVNVLKSQMTMLEKAVSDQKDNLSDEGFNEILLKAQQIPAAIIDSYSSKLRKISSNLSGSSFVAQKKLLQRNSRVCHNLVQLFKEIIRIC